MPSQPHPIEVTVYDTDNASLKADVKVYVRNVTKRTKSSEESTNSSGVATIDLANLSIASGQTNPYDTGDEVLIIAYHGHHHDAVKYTVTGNSKEQSLYLNPVKHYTDFAKERIQTIIVANTSASTAYYCKIYSLNDGKLLVHIECPAADTKIAYVGGMGGDGGFVVERENKDLIVTVVTK